jgi:hypothetical protein
LGKQDSHAIEDLLAEKHDYTFSAKSLQSGGILQSESEPLFYNRAIPEMNTPPLPSERAEKKTENNADLNSKSRFSLALSFSPDINSVSNFSNSSFGNSLGIGLSYRVTSRLSVSTAIGYSKKIYTAEPYQYKAPWANIAAKYNELIDADCRVLDIPVNLNYSLVKTSKKAVFVEAGLSSYLMLREKYTLVDQGGQSGYPAYPDLSYSYKNKNQHILSVLNLSLGIAKPVSKQTSLVIAPYARLPLTGIGQGKVNLQSVGLNLQLQFNFRKKAEKELTSINAAQ